MKSASKRITQEAERGSIVQILVEWRMEWMPAGELRLHLLRRAGYQLSEEDLQFHLNYLERKGYLETKRLRAARAGLEMTAVRATARGVDLAEGRIAEEEGVSL
jgi:repressor of nif and glnA expression